MSERTASRNRREWSEERRILMQLFARAEGGQDASPLLAFVAPLLPAKLAAHTPNAFRV